MDLVIAQINRNNARIPTLWTQLNYTATLVDPKTHSTTTVSGDGGLIFARPLSLLLTGNKDVAGQVFQLGSNDSEFWVRLRSSSDSRDYWWGHYANLDKPGCEPIPIRPDMVLQVLGIGLYSTDFLQQPVPVMRFDNDNDCYIFDLNVRTPDRWETEEEVWYNRKDKQPVRVLIYGENGRVALRADLSNAGPLELPDVPREQWPLIAQHYDLSFPDSGTQISFDFLNPALQHTPRRGPSIPNSNTFMRTSPEDNDKVHQIDANCRP
jgi:hypothetical protein